MVGTWFVTFGKRWWLSFSALPTPPTLQGAALWKLVLIKLAQNLPWNIWWRWQLANSIRGTSELRIWTSQHLQGSTFPRHQESLLGETLCLQTIRKTYLNLFTAKQSFAAQHFLNNTKQIHLFKPARYKIVAIKTREQRISVLWITIQVPMARVTTDLKEIEVWSHTSPVPVYCWEPLFIFILCYKRQYFVHKHQKHSVK